MTSQDTYLVDVKQKVKHTDDVYVSDPDVRQIFWYLLSYQSLKGEHQTQSVFQMC